MDPDATGTTPARKGSNRSAQSSSGDPARQSCKCRRSEPGTREVERVGLRLPRFETIERRAECCDIANALAEGRRDNATPRRYGWKGFEMECCKRGRYEEIAQ